ncbi:MAG: hypothetical protein J6Y54_06580 [Lentisphaeria bacterium]|nr:hypothetical protein [Lentisphaeria bacterium]
MNGNAPHTPIPPFVPLAQVEDAVRTVFSTAMEEYDARRPAMAVLEGADMHCTPEEYAAFYAPGLDLAPAEVARAIEAQPILHFYEAAFDKVKRELESVTVAPGSAVLWHVYNMGYVVKTHDACFALDLHHRRSEELIPMLDFLVVTHDHTDHKTARLLDGFAGTGKPIISNFYPHAGYSATPQTLKLGSVVLHTCITDHNRKLPNFVQPCEIEIPGKGRKIVIFTGGDTFDPTQFKMHNSEVDVFIVHPRVGLVVTEAQKTVNPRLTLISHLLEMHHYHDQWRWGFDVGSDELTKSSNADRAAAIPMWGDRIVLE